MNSRGTRLAGLALVAALVMSGCGDNDKKGSGATESPSGSTTSSTPTDSETQYTEPGTELGLGETATMIWNPKTNLSGVVAVTVERLDKTTIRDFRAFKLDRAMKLSTPYYVHVSVENLGDTDLSGVSLPLFLDNGSDVLIPSAKITSAFKPCPSRPFPDNFVTGKTAELCLVFLAAAKTELKAIAMRPSEDLQAITWTGKITRPVVPKTNKKTKKS